MGDGGFDVTAVLAQGQGAVAGHFG